MNCPQYCYQAFGLEICSSIIYIKPTKRLNGSAKTCKDLKFAAFWFCFAPKVQTLTIRLLIHFCVPVKLFFLCTIILWVKFSLVRLETVLCLTCSRMSRRYLWCQQTWAELLQDTHTLSLLRTRWKEWLTGAFICLLPPQTPPGRCHVFTSHHFTFSECAEGGCLCSRALMQTSKWTEWSRHSAILFPFSAVIHFRDVAAAASISAWCISRRPPSQSNKWEFGSQLFELLTLRFRLGARFLSMLSALLQGEAVRWFEILTQTQELRALFGLLLCQSLFLLPVDTRPPPPRHPPCFHSLLRLDPQMSFGTLVLTRTLPLSYPIISATPHRCLTDNPASGQCGEAVLMGGSRLFGTDERGCDCIVIHRRPESIPFHKVLFSTLDLTPP